jgi:hypothetical protein
MATLVLNSLLHAIAETTSYIQVSQQHTYTSCF